MEEKSQGDVNGKNMNFYSRLWIKLRKKMSLRFGGWVWFCLSTEKESQRVSGGCCSLGERLQPPSLSTPSPGPFPASGRLSCLEVLTKFPEHPHNYFFWILYLINFSAPLLESETSTLLFRAEYAGWLVGDGVGGGGRVESKRDTVVERPG